jgi:hypothetical protein
MRLALLFAVAATTVFVFATTASAKGLTSLKACGASGCTTITDRDQLRGVPLGGSNQIPPPKTAPYYVLEFTVDRGETHFLTYYVPSAHAVAGNGEYPGRLVWFPTDESFARIVGDLEPFPAPAHWPAEVKSPGRLPVSASTTARDDNGRGPLGWLVIVLAVAAPVAVAAALGWAAHRRRATTAPQT